MNYLSLKNIFPIGIGTWGYGGFVTKDSSIDVSKQVKGIRFMFENGFNFVEANMWSAEGQSVKLVADAYKQSGLSRDKVFLTQTIYVHSAKTLEQAQKEFVDFREAFCTNYVDSLQVHVASFETYGYLQTVEFIKSKIESSETRFTSITNPSFEDLKKYHYEFGDKLFGNEVGFNFEIRKNVRNGVLSYADKNGIKNVIYQPLRRNRTANRHWPLLENLSNKYNKSVNQIILSWIISKGWLPITKSETISHIKEHIEAVKLKLEDEDIVALDEFNIPKAENVQVFYGLEGDGIRIDQLSNVIDDVLDGK